MSPEEAIAVLAAPANYSACAQFMAWRELVQRAVARRWPDHPPMDEGQLALRWLVSRTPLEVAQEYVTENPPAQAERITVNVGGVDDTGTPEHLRALLGIGGRRG